MSNQNGKKGQGNNLQKNIEKTPETGSKNPETIERKDEFRKEFMQGELFKNLIEQFPPTNEAKEFLKKITDKIATSYENLRDSSDKKERLLEKISKKYEISPDIKMEELAIIDVVENDIGKNLETNDKLELIRLLGGFEIKLNSKEISREIDKSEYSKEMLNNPNTSIVEGLYIRGEISKQEFEDFVKDSSFDKALEKNKNIKGTFEELLQNNKEKNIKEFFKSFLNYLPDEIKDSYIIKQLEKSFVLIGEISNVKDKKISIFVSLEKTLADFLDKHKYFYKPDNYYEAIDYIRKDPGEENIAEFFPKKLNALAYVMQLAGERPWEVEEKHLEAGEQKKAVELREEKFEKISESSSPVFEKIKKLLQKNEERGQEKISEALDKMQYIRYLEEKDRKAANNPFYTPGNPSEILSEEDEEVA